MNSTSYVGNLENLKPKIITKRIDEQNCLLNGEITCKTSNNINEDTAIMEMRISSLESSLRDQQAHWIEKVKSLKEIISNQTDRLDATLNENQVIQSELNRKICAYQKKIERQGINYIENSKSFSLIEDEYIKKINDLRKLLKEKNEVKAEKLIRTRGTSSEFLQAMAQSENRSLSNLAIKDKPKTVDIKV